MTESSFFSMLFRMKHIYRWSLMRNNSQESLSQHSFEVAVIAHSLAMIYNQRNAEKIDANSLTVLALFHDASEIFTGDMPTPIKYQNNRLHNAYKEVEDLAQEKLLALLPEELQSAYEPIIKTACTKKMHKLLKAADKIAALIKCIDEEQSGNADFASAKQAQLSAIREMNLPEADIFLKTFLSGFSKTLDEQSSSHL